MGGGVGEGKRGAQATRQKQAHPHTRAHEGARTCHGTCGRKQAMLHPYTMANPTNHGGGATVVPHGAMGSRGRGRTLGLRFALRRASDKSWRTIYLTSERHEDF